MDFDCHSNNIRVLSDHVLLVPGFKVLGQPGPSVPLNHLILSGKWDFVKHRVAVESFSLLVVIVPLSRSLVLPLLNSPNPKDMKTPSPS